MIEQLEARFDKMTVTRGKEHTLLGMKIRYTGHGTAVITMKQYLEEAIVESGMDIRQEAATPALRNLFDVNESSPALKKTDAEAFHSVTSKLLYVSLRARVDLLLAVAFLCTLVSKSTEQDNPNPLFLTVYSKNNKIIKMKITCNFITLLLSCILVCLQANCAIIPANVSL
jgi:hypothetical protein